MLESYDELNMLEGSFLSQCGSLLDDATIERFWVVA